MNKILLVYEDYPELMTVESALKKVGFNVIGLSSEYSITEQVLSFNPDVVIGFGRGGKFSSFSVGKRLKEMLRWQGRSILIFPSGLKPAAEDIMKIRMDFMLEAPVPIKRMLQVLAQLLGQDQEQLIERLHKIVNVDSNSNFKPAMNTHSSTDSAPFNSVFVSGNSDPVKFKSFKLGLGENNRKFPFHFSERPNKENVKTFAEESVKNRVESISAPSRDSNGIREESDPSLYSGDSSSSLDSEVLKSAVPLVDEAKGETESHYRSSQEHSPVVDKKSALQDLVTANSELAGKMKKYKEIVKNIKVSSESTLSRVEARRRQRELSADWDTKNLSDLDDLRREFVAAIMKK